MKLVDDLGNRGVLKPLVKLKLKGRHEMDKNSSYMANPDVSLREEGGDGAILFNADTDSLLIINPVGQIIWNYLKSHPRTKSDIIYHIREMCDDVPKKQVKSDVDTFLNDLYNRGFIGEVLDEKNE